MGAINGLLGLVTSVQPAASTPATAGAGALTSGGAIGGVGATPGTTGAAANQGFGDVVVKALDGLQSVQNNADGLAVKAATGDLNDVHNYTIAASEASLATDFTVAMRDRAVEAFQEIMRMQV